MVPVQLGFYGNPALCVVHCSCSSRLCCMLGSIHPIPPIPRSSDLLVVSVWSRGPVCSSLHVRVGETNRSPGAHPASGPWPSQTPATDVEHLYRSRPLQHRLCIWAPAACLGSLWLIGRDYDPGGCSSS